jgi:hypothetical protein
MNLIQGNEYVISKPRKIKRRCYWNKIKKGMIFVLYICLLLIILLLFSIILCLFTFLFDFFSEFTIS